jgi:nucleotide-binding universal stress UspA family protein
MTIRKILLLLTDTSVGGAALTTTLSIARRWNAHVSALCVRGSGRAASPAWSARSSGVTVDESVGTPARAADDWEDAARVAFESIVADHHVTVGDARHGLDHATASFAVLSERQKDIFAQQARLADLTIVPHPGTKETATFTDELHAALFDSGRPVLLAPRQEMEVVGARVCLAWNGTAESAESVLSALPWMIRAEAVCILSAEEYQRHGPAAPDLASYLAFHGITADIRTFPIIGNSVGAGLLEAARQFSCDLLSMGAYSHSRLRQLILGGVTQHVLENAAIPVLMTR